MKNDAFNKVNGAQERRRQRPASRPRLSPPPSSLPRAEDLHRRRARRPAPHRRWPQGRPVEGRSLPPAPKPRDCRPSKTRGEWWRRGHEPPAHAPRRAAAATRPPEDWEQGPAGGKPARTRGRAPRRAAATTPPTRARRNPRHEQGRRHSRSGTGNHRSARGGGRIRPRRPADWRRSVRASRFEGWRERGRTGKRDRRREEQDVPTSA